MDKPIDRRTSRNRNLKKVLPYLLGIMVIILATIAVHKLLNRSLHKGDLIISTVKQGNMINTISATGVVKPSSEILVISPFSTKIKKLITQDGEQIKKGETMLVLDTEFAQLEYSKLKDGLDLKENNVARLQLALEKDLRDLDLDNQIKQLEVTNLMTQLTDAQRLVAIGGATKEEVERAEQSLKIAQLEKAKLHNELEFRKASLEVDVDNERLESTIQKTTLHELGKRLKLAQVTAPSSGVITWINQSIGSSVAEGDPLVRIADLSSYSVEAVASDMHTEKINIGMPVHIRINNQNLKGRIQQILPALENNTIKFRIALEQPDSDLLRANMQVDVHIVSDRKPNTLYISNGPGIKGGKNQQLFVIEGDRLIRRGLTFGLINRDQVEILDGVQAGEQVIIGHMDNFKNHKMISLK